MNVINVLRSAYGSNKKIFVIALLIIVAVVIVGCTTGQAGTAPSGPIGGGCGG